MTTPRDLATNFQRKLHPLTVKREEEFKTLVGRALAGDRDADGSLMHGALKAVTRLLRNNPRFRTLPNAIIDELTQDCYFKIRPRLAEFEKRDPGAFTAFLCKVAANRGLDYLRRRRLEEAHAASLAHPVQARACRPSEPIDLRLVLRQAVDKLPPGQAEVTNMYYYQGKSYAEIAADLSIDVGTVSSQIHDAIKKLGKLMGAK